jgi:hypothetical protein
VRTSARRCNSRHRHVVVQCRRGGYFTPGTRRNARRPVVITRAYTSAHIHGGAPDRQHPFGRDGLLLGVYQDSVFPAATADAGLHPRPIGGADGVQAAAYASLTLTVPACSCVAIQ